MITININKKKFKLPTSLYELTYEQGITIEEYKKLLGNTIVSKKAILSYLMGCSDEIIDSVVEEEIDILYGKLDYLNDASKIYLYKTIKIKGKVYGLINFEDLTVEELGAIERVLSDNIDNSVLALPTICAIMYREVLTTKRTFKQRLFPSNGIEYNCNSYVLKPFNIKAQNSSIDLFEDNLNYGILLSVLAHFIDYKDKLSKKYWLLYSTKETDEYEVDDSVKSISSISDIWGIYHQLMIISDNNQESVDYWKRQTVDKLFTYLSYLKQLNEYKNR